MRGPDQGRRAHNLSSRTIGSAQESPQPVASWSVRSVKASRPGALGWRLRGIARQWTVLARHTPMAAASYQDYVQAYMWHTLAASRLTGGEREISVKARDGLVNVMTPAQLTEGPAPRPHVERPVPA